MTPMITHPITLEVSAALPAGPPADPWYDIVEFDDGTLRVRGRLPAHAREQLKQSHFDTGTRIDRWSVWAPREVQRDS